MCDGRQDSRPPRAFFGRRGPCVGAAALVFLACSTRAAQFAGGAGTAAAPYEVATAQQLVAIGADPNLLNRYFALSADIDLDPNRPGGQVFPRAVIAYDEDPYGGPRVAFTGRFYGNGHTIRHLTLDGAGLQYLGLFGRIGSSGRIYDLALEEVRIRAADHAGALAGLNEGGITNCSVTGHIQALEPARSAAARQGSWLGGLAGINAGTMLDCRADVTLTAGDHGLMLGLLVGLHRGGMVNCRAGGALTSGAQSLCLGLLAGACSGGIIRDSRACGSVVGGDGSWALGALAGRADAESVIVNCWAGGTVAGGARSHDLGGLVGTCFGVEIADCCAAGAVTGGPASHSLGGLLGSCLGATVSDCYATGTICGFRTLGGFAGRVQAGTSIIHCHAVGRMLRGSSPWGQGGFVGRIDSPADVRITGCFWDVEASEASASAAGTGLTTPQMQEARIFQAAGWDMAGDRTDGTADLWLVPEGGRYPVLTALPAPGPEGCPRPDGALRARASGLRIGADSYRPHLLQGTGTSSDPYRIATAEDLGAIGRYSRSAPGRSGAAGWYRLVADIDLSGITWSAPPVPAFDGIFDGRGHRLRSLTLRGDGQEPVGLFGRVGRAAWVFDLGLEDVSIDVPDRSVRVGALAGENAGHILNCRVTGTMAGGNDCRSLGGLVGVNWLGAISDCYTVFDLRAGARSVQAGGLIGYNYMGTVAHCYTAGRVLDAQTDSFGALVGRSSEHAVTSHCYYLAAVAGGGPDRAAGTAVTAEQMRQQATFVDWDFRETWMLCEGRGYPHLRWEGIGCDE